MDPSMFLDVGSLEQAFGSSRQSRSLSHEEFDDAPESGSPKIGVALDASLQQIFSERVMLVGRPSKALLFTLLRQHAARDVRNVVRAVHSIVRYVPRTTRWVVYRLRKSLKAVRLIRHYWLASRYRFASKIARLIEHWERMEERSHKESAASARLRRNAAFDYLDIPAPLALKKQTLLVQYKRLLNEFLARWNTWWRRAKIYIERVKVAQTIVIPQKRADYMALLDDPGKEPDFRWFEILHSLTHEQLFDLSLRLQKASTDRGASIRAASNAVDDYVLHQDDEDDAWISLSLRSMDSFSGQIYDRRMEADRMKKSRFAHVVAKIFTPMDETQGLFISTEGGAKEKKSQNEDTGIAELKSMPVVSKFKSGGWHIPPRPLPNKKFVPRTIVHRRCDPPSYFDLTPMCQSLSLRGVISAPKLSAANLSPARLRQMDDLMKRVDTEVRALPATFCSVRDLLRTTKAKEITLGLVPKQLQRRPKTAPRRGGS